MFILRFNFKYCYPTTFPTCEERRLQHQHLLYPRGENLSKNEKLTHM